ncbi:hypothetical protein Dimus_018603 [Dionaea muscipula]
MKLKAEAVERSMLGLPQGSTTGLRVVGDALGMALRPVMIHVEPRCLRLDFRFRGWGSSAHRCWDRPIFWGPARNGLFVP